MAEDYLDFQGNPGAASGERGIDSNVLPSPAWKRMQVEMDAVRTRVSSKLQIGAVGTQDDVSAELEAEGVAEGVADAEDVDEAEAMIEGVQTALDKLEEC
jgi:hypothetical protein